MTGNEKLCKIYFKKLFFQNVLAFIIFFMDTIIFVISSTQIACDVICVQYVLMFSCEISKIFKNIYFEKHLWMTADQMICHKILLDKVKAVFHI